MRKIFLSLALLALAAVGIISISGCRKKPQDLFEETLSEKMQCKTDCHTITMTVDKSAKTMRFSTEVSEVYEENTLMKCHRFLFKDDITYFYSVINNNLVSISPIPAYFNYVLLDDDTIELATTGETDCAMPQIVARYKFTKI